MAIFSLAAALLCATTLRVNAFDSDKRDVEFQTAFDQFPLLKLETNAAGKPAFQTLKLEKAVQAKGGDYYGFRFQVPPRSNHEDFVWAFIVPGKLSGWYVLAQKGEMDGFENFYNGRTRATYEGTEHLFPTSAKQLYLQRLSGDSIKDGETYLVWFLFKNGKPNQMSLKFSFADLGKKQNKIPAIEKALGLEKRK
jgi:hypothetical protein